jgi:lipoprotein-anchoring transpeptidase ErfK/SrfK
VLAVGAGLLAACAILGFASAFAIAASAAGTETDTTVTTTEPPPTTTTTEPPPTQPPPPPKPKLIAAGVTVGNLLVGWMTPERATKAVRETYEQSLVLVVSPTKRIAVTPGELGAEAKIEKAIRRARVARAGASVPLDVDVSRMRIRGYVTRLARKLDSDAVDAGIVLRGTRPRIVEAAEGRRLKILRNALEIRVALKTHLRDPLEVAFDVLKPKVFKVKVRNAVVILRDSKKLRFFANDRFQRSFPIATGQAAYPTPVGSFEIETLQRDPWWYPPPSPWAQDADPVPPGPGNPLGTRWMGLDEPYVGIHGTPDSASIGYSASHGCIRMRIPDAEWLFRHVKVGTPVFIVSK